jgi:hypothetical protein
LYSSTQAYVLGFEVHLLMIKMCRKSNDTTVIPRYTNVLSLHFVTGTLHRQLFHIIFVSYEDMAPLRKFRKMNLFSKKKNYSFRSELHVKEESCWVDNSQYEIFKTITTSFHWNSLSVNTRIDLLTYGFSGLNLIYALFLHEKQ